MFSFQLRSLFSQTGLPHGPLHTRQPLPPQPSPCGPPKQTRLQCLGVYTPTCGSGCLLSVGCDPTSQDATVHLLNLQLPVLPYFLPFSICKWHFSGQEGGSGPQLCFLCLLALPVPIKGRCLWCARSAGLRRGVRGKRAPPPHTHTYPGPAVLTTSVALLSPGQQHDIAVLNSKDRGSNPTLGFLNGP